MLLSIVRGLSRFDSKWIGMAKCAFGITLHKRARVYYEPRVDHRRLYEAMRPPYESSVNTPIGRSWPYAGKQCIILIAVQ